MKLFGKLLSASAPLLAAFSAKLEKQALSKTAIQIAKAINTSATNPMSVFLFTNTHLIISQDMVTFTGDLQLTACDQDGKTIKTQKYQNSTVSFISPQIISFSAAAKQEIKDLQLVLHGTEVASMGMTLASGLQLYHDSL